MNNELVGFWDIDPYDDVNWTPEQREAAEFLSKRDSEGGTHGLLRWGGPEAFPEELQGLAKRTELALDYLQNAIRDWAAERGVQV